MSVIYFPSCKFTVRFPQISQKIKNYLRERHGAETTGCCRPNLDKITEADRVVYICNTCAAFLNESTQAAKVVSIWELVAEDAGFPYPDHAGRVTTLQDCWRTYDDRSLQEAVRLVLRKMNVEIVELEENHEKTRFCGFSLYEPLPAQYAESAPKRLAAGAGRFFKPHSEREKEALMREHCGKITTPEAVCYCVACLNGLGLGGKNGVHLAELVFGDGFFA